MIVSSTIAQQSRYQDQILDNLDPMIFREYDIRGIVGQTLTNDIVYFIGQAFGSFVREANAIEVAIARDGRVSGQDLAMSLAQGIMASGCHVIDLGPAPTPVLYYATHILPDRTGIMLTGSHNPADYNGMKIVLNGKMFAGKAIQQLYQRLQTKKFLSGKGSYRELHLNEHYCRKLTQNIHLQKPLRIVVDAGNGITALLAPDCFEALGCEVEKLYCEVDGNFPNHHPDPGDPNNLRDLIHTVKSKQADVGFAFDGDGDRLGIVTPAGQIVYPDRLLMLFAKDVLSKHPHGNIIFDVKCTDQLAPLIREYGGEPIMWKTGHSLIKAKIAETAAILAGEMSGHFFFNDKWYGFDDAIYAGARLLEILASSSQNLDELFAAFPNAVNTPELKINVREEEKFSLMQTLIDQANFHDAKEVMTIDGLRVSFTDGWGLVRPSNTTPCLILRFEALNQTIMTKIQQLFREWLLSVKPDLVLPF